MIGTALALGLLASAFSVARADGIAMRDSQMVLGGFSSHDVALGDLNGDGSLDAFVSGNMAFYVWIGDGTGLFTGTPAHGLSNSTVACDLGDLDGDGDLDAFVAMIAAPNQIHLNDGTGTFTLLGTTTGNNNSQGVALGDVDRDGDLDAVVANVNQPNRVWLNDGSGNFTDSGQALDADDSRGVVLADVDNDGDLDAAFANNSGNPNRIYLNDGNGVFTDSGQAIGTEDTRALAAGDVNRDGAVDLFYGNSGTSNTVCLNDGEGSFSVQPPGYGIWGTHGLSLGDLDNDGDLDAFESNWIQTNRVYKNNGSGLFSEIGYTLGTSGRKYEKQALGDFDKDGDLDVYVSVVSGGDRIMENRLIHRSAAFPGYNSVSSSQQNPYGVATADFNNDGRLDIVVASQNDDRVAVYLGNTGRDGFAAATNLTTSADGAFGVAVGDLNRDGLVDVVSASETDDRIAWYPNQGDGTFGAMTDINSPDPDGAGTGQGDANGAVGVAVGDMDGDGDLDVLSASWVDHKIAIYYNTDGAGTFGSQQVVSMAATGARTVQAVDMDGDGDLDILFSAYAFDKIGWFENTDGAGTFSDEKVITDTAEMAYFATAADLDGDGDPDVLSASVADNKIAWYQNLDGKGTFGGPNVLTTSATSAQWVEAADVDNDGDRDVLYTGWGGGVVAWFENLDGRGTFGPSESFGAPISHPRAILARDVDGDGDLDAIVTGGPSPNSIAWYPNSGGQFAWQTTDVAPAQITAGNQATVMTLEATHRGRPGDTAVQLVGTSFRLESAMNVNMTTEEANALIDSIAVYVDDGSGAYEYGHDVMVTNLSPLTLNNGVFTMPFAGPQENVQVEYGTPLTLLVVVKLSSEAFTQSPNQFRMIHLPRATADASDADFDIPLALESPRNVMTGFVTAAAAPTMWILR